MARPKNTEIKLVTNGRRIVDREKTMLTILEHLRRGVSIEGSCSAAGICIQTYYNWRKANPDFDEEADKALGEAEAFCISIIQTDPSWQSKAWLLERRFPDRYARKVRQDEAGALPNKIKLTWAPENDDNGELENDAAAAPSQEKK